jgi:hypothetical protein
VKKFIKVCLLASIASAVSLSMAQIRIGQTAGFTGPVRATVKETTAGAMLYIDSINAKGGVHGQVVELISLDDQFDPKIAAENGKKLVEEHKVLAMFLTRGTPHTVALLPLLEQYGVPLVAPSTGAMVLHDPVQRHVFNVRTPYQREAEKGVNQLLSMGFSRIGLVSVDDGFGADGVAGALKGFASAKMAPVFHEKFDRSKPDFGPMLAKVLSAKPQNIFIIGSGQAVVGGIVAFRTAGVDAQFATLSNNASGGFIKLLGSNAYGLIVTQVFPSERAVSYALVSQARQLSSAKGGEDISPATLEGFAAAKVLVEALRRAGPKPSRAKIQAALEGLQNFDLGGLTISYSKQNHTGLEFSDLSMVNASGKFMR